MRWFLTIALGVLVAYITNFIFWTTVKLGVFETVYNQSPGPCRVILVNGSEDIVLLQSGHALISSGLHEIKSGSVSSHIPPRDGNILLFDFNKPEDNVKKLNLLSSSTFDPKQLNPHGMSYWQDPDSGTVWLYVVNHLLDGEAIEVFEYIPNEYSLKHVKQIQHSMLVSPNDLLVVGPDSFYFTDDHYFRNHLLKVIEGYLQLPISSVGFYDGETQEARQVASSLKFPNGINMSPDGRFLYITTAVGLELIIYKRNKTDNSLALAQIIQMVDSCDNLFFHVDTGDLWTGCHPRVIDTIQHLYHNVSHRSGSLVLRIRLGPENVVGHGVPFPDYTIDQIYSNDGRQLKGSSVAVYYEGNMLVGTVVDNLLYCEVKSLQP